MPRESESTVISLPQERVPSRTIALPDGVGVTASTRCHAQRMYARLAIAIAVTDVISIGTALLIPHLAGFGHMHAGPTTLLSPLILIGLFVAFDLYGPQNLAPHEEFHRLIGATGVVVVLLTMISYRTAVGFASLWVGVTWIAALMLVLLSRYAWHRHMGRLRREGRLLYRTLIVGTNEEAAHLGHILQDPASGFEPLGFVATQSVGRSPDGLPVIGSLEGLGDLIKDHDADCLFVCASGLPLAHLQKITSLARRLDLDVRVTTNVAGIRGSRLTFQQLGELTTLSLKHVKLTGAQAIIKRIFDVIVAGLVLMVSAPIWIAVATAIKATSKGPVLFRQTRITKDRRKFTMLKFRTMVQDQDAVMHKHQIDLGTPFFKLDQDPRLTRVGSLIRRFSLDELPQLLNVLAGDMSLVGPRPLPVEQVEGNPVLLGPRCEVPAGVTGWWQINGRSNVTPEGAVKLDEFYIENWSISLDLFILLKTGIVLLSGRGAK